MTPVKKSLKKVTKTASKMASKSILVNIVQKSKSYFPKVIVPKNICLVNCREKLELTAGLRAVKVRRILRNF
jgi:hypothetical protein